MTGKFDDVVDIVKAVGDRHAISEVILKVPSRFWRAFCEDMGANPGSSTFHRNAAGGVPVVFRLDGSRADVEAPALVVDNDAEPAPTGEPPPAKPRRARRPKADPQSGS